MSDVTRIRDEALRAMKDKGTLQAIVRELLGSKKVYPTEAHTLNIICEGVAQFKEASILSDEYFNNRKATEKIVNNIINDVSRICREITGYSIKLKSRKGGYKYEPVKYEPRTSTRTSTIKAEVSPYIPVGVAIDKEIATAFIKDNPRTAIDILITHCGIETASEFFLEELKKAKAKEDEV